MSTKKPKGKKPTNSKTIEPSTPELQTIEELIKANATISALEKELEVKNDLINRQKTHFVDQKKQIEMLELEIEQRVLDRVQLSGDMARQYKNMQAELSVKISELEMDGLDLRSRLLNCQTALIDANKESERIISEKDSEIEDQHVKMSYLSSEFEQMLNDTLVKMTKKVECVSQRWKESEGIKLSEASQKRLADFQVSRCLN